MSDKKTVYYPASEEFFGDPSSRAKNNSSTIEDYKKVARLISVYTGVPADKILYFLKSFGISKVLNEPSIIGLTADQELKFKELKVLLEKGDE